MASLEDTRLSNCVTFAWLMRSAGCLGGEKKAWIGCLLDDLRAFEINADQ